MATVVLPAVLALTLGRSILVVDAVFSIEKRGAIARATRTVRSIASHSLQAPTAASPTHLPRQRNKGPGSTNGSQARSLHVKLLISHALAALSQGAVVLKYALPVSDTSCRVTHRLFLSLVLLFDASLITFLLEKVKVTNANRSLSLWEKCIIWLTRAYAWIYLPLGCIMMARSFPGVASSEGDFCYNGWSSAENNTHDTRGNATQFVTHSATVMVQFVFLLGVFLKPMLGPAEGTQSGGALYRRVVVRNVVCTSCIVTAYVIMTVVAGFALLHETHENDEAAQVRDIALASNALVTLCLTEISLPLGFTSCWKAIDTERNQEGDVSRPVIGAAVTAAKTAVVPVEGLPPQTP